MFCRKCGNEIKEGAKFCGKCGLFQDISTVNSMPSPKINSAFQQKVTYQSVKSAILNKHKKFLFVITALVIIIVIVIIVKAAIGNSSGESSVQTITDEHEIVTETYTTEASKYQKTNYYNIKCNGNNDLAIEAANVFANKYGGSDHDWVLTGVDASVSGMEGTYRYSYTWAGSSYTATTDFTITDYGSYRNYVWDGDFVDLFYGG